MSLVVWLRMKVVMAIIPARKRHSKKSLQHGHATHQNLAFSTSSKMMMVPTRAEPSMRSAYDARNTTTPASASKCTDTDTNSDLSPETSAESNGILVGRHRPETALPNHGHSGRHRPEGGFRR